MAELGPPPSVGGLTLEPLVERHRPALAAACAEDAAIWPIYSASFDAGHFDASFDALVAGRGRAAFAVMVDGVLAGMSAYIGPDWERRVVEVGNTYLRPAFRGTGFNRRLKQLMLDHAFACGYRRIEFRIDARNARSRQAVAKLGAVEEGILRQERVTWTGHVRDTVLFSILASEWRTAG